MRRAASQEAAIAMLDLEEPRCARALHNVIADLQKNAEDLPVPLALVKKVNKTVPEPKPGFDFQQGLWRV